MYRLDTSMWQAPFHLNLPALPRHCVIASGLRSWQKTDDPGRQ